MNWLTESIEVIEEGDFIKLGFTTKVGGVNPQWGFNLGFNTKEKPEEVSQNRKYYIKKLGSHLDYVFANQVHSNKVEVVSQPGTYNEVDGFVTNQKGVVLNIQTADCLAILAHDIENGVIGAFHAGWRGTSEKIVVQGIEKMLHLGAVKEHLFVYLSSCIKVEHYEVGPELLSHFPDSSFIRKEGRLYFDLIKENIRQLHEIEVTNIRCSSYSTYNNNQLYSYRRDKEKAGRSVNFIYLV